MAIHNLETEVLQELVTLLLNGIDEYMCVTLEIFRICSANSQKYLSFTNGDFCVAAVPESISLLHSYLWMWPLSIVSPTILAPLTKSAGFPGAQGTRERAA